MKISERGLELIQKWEGCRLDAYKDGAGIRTIGWGHAYWKGPDHITQQEADEMLKQDVIRFELEVSKYMPTYEFNQNEFDALVSFCYNVGSIRQLTDNGSRSREVIAEKILQYNKMAGKKVQGLADRRIEERDLFLEPCRNDSIKLSEREVAKRVIAGDYGNGEERKRKLREAGFDYDVIQSIVNNMLKKTSTESENVALAKEVIQGKWGNGEERIRRLTEAGHDYKEIQTLVNQMLKN